MLEDYSIFIYFTFIYLDNNYYLLSSIFVHIKILTLLTAIKKLFLMFLISKLRSFITYKNSYRKQFNYISIW